MNNVILYTTHCPKCRVLETKLKSKNINYVEETDETIMQKKNIEFLPMLEVDGNLMDFATANVFINNYNN
jgi:glutaredoxin-related protein